jgi:hypothetical protein
MKKLSEVVSTGKMVGPASSAFRNTSTSKPDDWHDRSGHDVGAARNYAHEKNAISKAETARRERENKIKDRTRKAEQRAKDTLRMAKESVESSGTAARVKIKNVARPDDANPTSEKSLLSKNGEIKVKKVDEEIADSISRKYGLTDSLIAASRAIMERKTQIDLDPETDDKVNADDDDDDDDVKKESKHTTPKSDKEKKLAALAHPRDKITHKDVLVGRGVLRKEEAEIEEEKWLTSMKHPDKPNAGNTYHTRHKEYEHSSSGEKGYITRTTNPGKKQTIPFFTTFTGPKGRDETHHDTESAAHKFMQSNGYKSTGKIEEEHINELKRSTLASYIKKSSDDATYHAFDAGRHYDTGEREKYAASDRNTLKRQAGVKMAVNKLAKEETETSKPYSKYEMSYEKGVSDESHRVVNKHLDLTKSPSYQKGEQITTPQRVKKLVHEHPDHKEMKDRGFRIKKYGEHSDSMHGKTTNEEAEQIDEEHKIMWSRIGYHQHGLPKSGYLEKTFASKEDAEKHIKKLGSSPIFQYSYAKKMEDDFQPQKKRLKEEIEQIDELKKSTLGSYVTKVAKLAPDQVKTSRREGIVKASQKLRKMDREDSSMKEEIEQIDELKKSTLASYVNKASNDATKHSYMAGKTSDVDKAAKASQRIRGVMKATTKLAKEEFSDDELARLEEIAKQFN